MAYDGEPARHCEVSSSLPDVYPQASDGERKPSGRIPILVLLEDLRPQGMDTAVAQLQQT
eukprot:752278-Hanusia_phi.AAC.4